MFSYNTPAAARTTLSRFATSTTADRSTTGEEHIHIEFDIFISEGLHIS